MSDLEAPRCLEHADDCSGAVEYRMPLSSTGRAFPRCDRHWELRLDEQERINKRYGSPSAPPDFDPLDAGETWSDDDDVIVHPYEHGAGGGDPDDGYY